jgi:hypothetical protein
MVEELGHRLSVLDASLEKFKAESNPSWQAGEIFNALLAIVKGSAWTRWPALRSVAAGLVERQGLSATNWEEDPMTLPAVLDAAGRRRSPATLPGYHAGRAPRNKGVRYPADRRR